MSTLVSKTHRGLLGSIVPQEFAELLLCQSPRCRYVTHCIHDPAQFVGGILARYQRGSQGCFCPATGFRRSVAVGLCGARRHFEGIYVVISVRVR